MRLPYRSITSIQPLPSIYTAFPVNYDNTDLSNNSEINSGLCLMSRIEDGIEVVPFERSKTPSAPILSPDQGEKEVFVVYQEKMDSSEKPLPVLPSSMWQRMSLRQRILAILGVQFVMLVTIGLALMAAKNHSSASDHASRARATGDESPETDSMNSIRRGAFAIPIQLPQQQSSSCLARMNESVAWQCASDTVFQLNILPSSPGDADTTVITLGPPPSNGSIYHGHQVPDIRPVELAMVPEVSSKNKSAYHFRTTYNRVVLLKEGDISQAERPRTQPVIRHPIFKAGESLWRCVFNETVIEGYVYVDQPTTPEVTNVGPGTNASSAILLPKVPYVVKIIEQRMPNGKGPYCEKMRLDKDGSMSSRAEKLMLNLSEPASERDAAKTELIRSAKFQERQQAQTLNHCRCQWMIQ
ncbi:hypothetical protein BKA66DRAFT_421903 [Pyrenochaeta sp. MPI-SDFR-AT-0127]|nr:hypothetical protein BKA66DRAFT_421903 [Pyrenochaeta sp. MPI-SDFR-AT-0127]